MEAALSSQAQPVSYLTAIRAAHHDPQQLEQLYQTAYRAKALKEFTEDVLVCHNEAPENLLYAAWFYRLEQTPAAQPARPGANWRLAAPLAVLTGLIIWTISDQNALSIHNSNVPYFALLWAPIAAVIVIGFLAFTLKQHYRRAALLSAGLAVLSAYAVGMASLSSFAGYRPYIDLMIPHLPLLAWGAVGLFVLGMASPPGQRFGFIAKSLEATGTGGVYAIGVYIFAFITYTMFQTLNIQLPDPVVRLIFSVGLGSIPLLAIASTYDPHLAPLAQEFRRGLGKIMGVLMWALLPLTLIVMVVYVGAIPFNFKQPFENRDVLLSYNAMLFAVMALLVGATPIAAEEFPVKYQPALRAVMLAVAGLAVLVSVYALAAIVYRTVQDTLTMNRFTVIGWNTINIVILAALLYTQFRRGRAAWIESLQSVFGQAALGYIVWAVVVTLAIPWLF